MTKKLKNFFALSFLLVFLINCEDIPIKDEIAYGALGAQGAIKVHTMTDTPPVNMSIKDFAIRWNELKDPLICLPSTAFADFKADLEKACTFLQSCTVDTQEAVDKVYSKIIVIKKAADHVISVNKKNQLFHP
jgi:hypothetical protein